MRACVVAARGAEPGCAYVTGLRRAVEPGHVRVAEAGCARCGVWVRVQWSQGARDGARACDGLGRVRVAEPGRAVESGRA